MDMRTHSALKLVPWESWQLWNQVREAIFSSSPERVSAALNKIAAWRARNSLPVAVEVTGDLISIQRADPRFLGSSRPVSPVTDEMLRLMYAMAIMRLVNGVVDQSKKQNSMSVAARAEAAGLPRMLVDIRHEVAHKELPSLSYLQLSSKQALEWLKVQYWEAQKLVLDDAYGHLRAKLHAHASLVETLQGNQLTLMPGSRTEKDSEQELVKLVSSSVPDVLSILADEGLLEQCVAGNGVWQYIVGKLCSRVPQLLKEVVSWCTKGNTKDVSGLELVNLLVGQACKKVLTSHASKLVKLSCPVTNLLSECNVTDEVGRTDLILTNARVGKLEELVCSNTVDNTIDVEFKKSECALLEAKKRLQSLHKSNYTMLHARSGPDCKGPIDTIDFSVTNSSLNIKTGHAEEHSSLKEGWTITDHWRPCAIGMLPSAFHSTGVLPFFGNMCSGLAREATCQATFQGESSSEAEVQISMEEDAMTAVCVEIKKADVKYEPVGEKRDHAENETKEGTPKRFKADTEAIQISEKQDDSCRIDMRVHSDVSNEERKLVGNGHLLLKKPRASLSRGFLLLDGSYQRCGVDQLAAIQSAIQVLK